MQAHGTSCLDKSIPLDELVVGSEPVDHAIAQPPGELTRHGWLAVLAGSDMNAIADRLRLLELPRLELVRPAETGLVMVRGRMGGSGRRFNLGETTVTRCAVRHGKMTGFGYVLGRDKEKARLVACCDALLQDEAHRSTLLDEVIVPLAKALTAARAAEARRAAATKVEFFTLVRGDG